VLRDWLRFLFYFAIYYGAAVAVGLVLASI
jgi:hypothetical protein